MTNSQLIKPTVICFCLAASALLTIQCALADEAAGVRSVASPPAATDTTPVNTSQHPSSPLQGKVEDHENSLPPLDDNFKVGTELNEAKLSSLTPDNIWIQVPDWFAGKWHSDIQTINYMYDYKSGASSSMERLMKAVSDIVYGMQQAKDGQIWSFVKLPRIEKQETEFGYAYLYALREDLLKYSDAKLVIKYFYYEIRTNPHNKILSVERVSSINTYTQLDEGLVRLKGSLKSFDEEGQPKLLQNSETVLKQVAPYREIDSEDGRDLHQLFAEFMQKTGRAL